MSARVVFGCWYWCRICDSWLIDESQNPLEPGAVQCQCSGSWMQFKFSRRLPEAWIGKGQIWRHPNIDPQMAREREILRDHYSGAHARCAEIFKETVTCQKLQTCATASSSSNPTLDKAL